MRSSRTKPELVKLVADTFRANGYHGTTISMVGERTGLGRSSIYHHFGRGKLEMAQSSLDAVEDFIVEIGEVCTSANGNVTDKWEQIAGLLQTFYEHGRLGCLLAVFAMEDVPDDLQTRTKSIFDVWLEAFASLYLQAGVGEEEAAAAARTDISAIQGGLVMSRAQRTTDAFDHAIDLIADRIAIAGSSIID